MRLRVVTYNVRGFRHGLDDVVEAVERLTPDVVLVQESGARRKLRSLAAATGMEVAGDPWSPLRRRVKNAVLVRPPWRVVQHRLHRFEASARFYPRGALVAQAGRAGRRIWAISTHLGLAPSERNAHARELTDVCAGLSGAPIVLGGDLNATPEQRAPGWLADRYWDAWATAGNAEGATFPASDPTARIDYVFASTGLVVEAASVGKAPDASDHLPVIAELRIEDAAGA
ncbi:MAG TPA: endonuclease/exonuclease/phosphatase family protein [Actinomycetota bacterium]|jgi:endonuclease/exonuclease/phosphatase family metal-dependent hydrolase|nr:endonuclease/exonuclease/phosphatase family protein [Actinomycetota bacterium]